MYALLLWVDVVISHYHHNNKNVNNIICVYISTAYLKTSSLIFRLLPSFFFAWELGRSLKTGLETASTQIYRPISHIIICSCTLYEQCQFYYSLYVQVRTSMYNMHSLVPRVFHCPVFDHLQYDSGNAWKSNKAIIYTTLSSHYMSDTYPECDVHTLCVKVRMRPLASSTAPLKDPTMYTHVNVHVFALNTLSKFLTTFWLRINFLEKYCICMSWIGVDLQQTLE